MAAGLLILIDVGIYYLACLITQPINGWLDHLFPSPVPHPFRGP
jgi:hypothetical protein